MLFKIKIAEKNVDHFLNNDYVHRMIDLHSHTTSSDGSLTPEQLVELACSQNLTYLAITDHDTVRGIEQAITAAENTELTIIPGIEISANFRQGEVHILGLGIDYKHPELSAFNKKMQNNRYIRNKAILELAVESGMISGNPEELIKKHTITGRPHIADLLIGHSVVKNRAEAFEKFLGSNKRFYRRRQLLEPEEIFSLIKKTGGVSIIAHPVTLLFSSDVKADDLEALFTDWKNKGLNGIEAFHPNIRPAFSRILRKYATQNYMLTTGGSDFHRAQFNKPELGRWHKKRRVPVGILNNLLPQIQHNLYFP